MKKGVIFDLDGTLLDTLESIAKSGNEMLKSFGLAPAPVSQYGVFAGDGADVLVERALRYRGENALSHLEEAKVRYRAFFREFCAYKVQPYEGILELLSQLKKQNILLAVYTNKPHENAARLVQEYFGENLFTHVIGQHSSRPRKPHPAGIFEITKDWGVSCEDCVYLGDSDVDMQTGKGANCLTVGALWGFRGKEELLLNGADATVSHPLELLQLMDIKE